LFSPFYKNLRILCCFEWKMKKNRWYLDRLQKHVTENGEAYLFLPPFLRKDDILSNNSFRITMIEIGTLLENGFVMEELTCDNTTLITDLIEKGESPFNYPELMRIYEIKCGKDKAKSCKNPIAGLSHSTAGGLQLREKSLDLHLQTQLSSKYNSTACELLAPSTKTGYKLDDSDSKRGCQALSWLIENELYVHDNKIIKSKEELKEKLEIQLRGEEEEDLYNPALDETMPLNLTTTPDTLTQSIINYQLS